MKTLALHRPTKPAFAALPLLFVMVWSLGYVIAKNALVYTGPLTLLLIVSATAAGALLVAVLLTKAPWPTRLRDWANLATAGALGQALFFIGLYGGLDQGMNAGIAALIVGLMPIAIALAGAFFDKRVAGKHWFGLWIGLAGIATLIADSVLGGNGTWLGYQALAFALMGVSAGMLYQKRFCTDIDLRTGVFIQLAAAAVIALPLAYVYEGLQAEPSLRFFMSSAWLAAVNALVAVALLHFVKQNEAQSQAGDYLFLVPSVTAAMACIALGETLSATAIVGFVLSGVAVYLCTRR